MRHIKAQLRGLFGRGQIVELRVPKGGTHGTIAGFFDNGNALAEAAESLSGRYPGVYFTLNPVHPDLFQRSPNRLTYNAGRDTLSTDDDITDRRWILVDADPVRPADVSATDAEKESAYDRAMAVRDALNARGFPEPVVADSGNGWHLLYRCELPNDAATRDLIRGFLTRLHEEFSTPEVTIDRKVSNAARICKLYGTMSCKGPATPDRPHRESEVIYMPDRLAIVTADMLTTMQPVLPAVAPAAPAPAPLGRSSGHKYAMAALDNASQRIAGAQPGTRNDTLNSEAYGIFQLVHGGELSQATAWAVMQQSGEQCGLTRSEVTSTLHSAFSAAADSPKKAPPMPDRSRPARPARPAPALDPETGEITEPVVTYTDPNPAKPVASVDVFAETIVPGLTRGMLPSVIEDYAFECSELIGVTPAMIAVPALVACAAALHDDVRIQPKRYERGWTESARLWCAIVGSPSVKKSPAIKRATKRMRKIDMELHDANAKKQADYATQMEIYKDAKKEAKKTGLYVQPPEVPVNVRMVVEDITVEALSEVLKDNSRGVLAIQDELSGWFGAMDAYSGGKTGGKDRAHWLEAYNGGGRVVDRVMRGTLKIPNWSVSIIGGIQPDSIRRIAANMTDDGLMQRFMVVIGGNTQEQDRPEVPDVTQAFSGLIDALYSIAGSETPVTLTPGAHEVRESLTQFAAQMAEHQSLPGGLRSHLGKWSGLFARLLLLFHSIESVGNSEHPTSRPVSKETAQRVNSLMRDFLLPHAYSYYTDVLGNSGDLEHVRWIAGYILSRNLSMVSNRDLMQAYRAWRGLDDWRKARVMALLEDYGWCMALVDPDAPKLHRRLAAQWVINPEVHTVFADRATKESARRAQVREILTGFTRP